MRSTLVLLLCSTAAAQQTPATEVIPEIKSLERALGFPETGNFVRHADGTRAFYRCYYTGKLELPPSYEELKLDDGTEAGCRVDEARYDVFFYPVEAVASGKAPVTESLAAATTERLLVVVPHEDFHHEHYKTSPLPAAVTEAAATLIGFLAAGEFARGKYGEEAGISRRLAQEPDLFLRKAELVNRYYGELARLYTQARMGRIEPEAALGEKAAMFQRAERECRAIPDPSSFKKCLAASNNAGLAFDRTYTQHYPLLHELFVANGRQVKGTVEDTQAVLRSRSEAEALAAAHRLIEERNGRR